MIEKNLTTDFDPRYLALRRGIAQLDDVCLERLETHISANLPLVLDEVHHDPVTGNWCALAVALDVPRVALSEFDTDMPADAGHETRVMALIQSVGQRVLGQFDINPISGTPGEFFRDDRYSDLRKAVADEIDCRAQS